MQAIFWFVFALSAVSAAGNMIHGKPGKTVKIECGAKTSNKDVVWNHNGILIVSIAGKSGRQLNGRDPISHRSKVKVDALEISDLEESDLGPFSCKVDGVVHHHTLYMVSVSVTPSTTLREGSEATLQCNVKGLNPAPTAKWQRPGPSGKPEGSGTVQLNPVASSDAGSWVCKIPLGGDVVHTETLDVRVEVPVTKPPIIPRSKSPLPGFKSSVIPSVNGTSKPQPGAGRWMLGLSLWMWGAIGAGCLVLVLLVVFVVLLHRRNRRMKRRIRKTVRQPLTAKQYCQCNRQTATAAPPRGRQREKPSALPKQ